MTSVRAGILLAAGAVWLSAAGMMRAGGAVADLAPADAQAAATEATRIDAGSSSRETRRKALAALPLDRIPEPQRQAVAACLKSATLYRRLPVETVVCDAELLDFALEKPEAIVDIWRVLGISRLALDPAGPGQWRLSDGYGTIGVLRQIHAERTGRGGLLVFHGKGAYTGPLSPKNLTGSCVILLRHSPAMPAVDGRERQTVQIDTFLDVDGVGLEIVTRTLQPLIVRSAASNLHEICLFVSTLSDSARSNPEGVALLAARLTQTQPADRQALAAIARRSARNAAGDRLPAAVDVAAVGRLESELASRWLSADELDLLQQK
jgi:hypothetical protein